MVLCDCDLRLNLTKKKKKKWQIRRAQCTDMALNSNWHSVLALVIGGAGGFFLTPFHVHKRYNIDIAEPPPTTADHRRAWCERKVRNQTHKLPKSLHDTQNGTCFAVNSLCGEEMRLPIPPSSSSQGLQSPAYLTSFVFIAYPNPNPSIAQAVSRFSMQQPPKPRLTPSNEKMSRSQCLRAQAAVLSTGDAKAE